MRIEITQASEVVWLDERHELSLTEFAGLSGLTMEELQCLIDCEALLPIAAVESAAQAGAADARFSAECLTLARMASRLRNDFDLDENGLTLTLRLLNRIQALELELRYLRAQSPQG